MAEEEPKVIPLKDAIAAKERDGINAPVKPNGSHHPAPFDVEEERSPEYSDDSLALGFSAIHGRNLRFVSLWGRWFQWDEARWRQDETMKTFDLARAVCREVAVGCNKLSTARTITSAKTVAAVVSLARSDRRHAATAEQWDSDPWVLNTPKGEINLKTGTMHSHKREHHHTKITAVGPGGTCPTWVSFLDRVTGGDKELQIFMQRMGGYALTGSTGAHALFFAHGTGANGKSVFITTLSGIMGDYATTAPMETFIATNYDQHPTNLAGLRGARLVTAVETEEGRRWAESKIKALTGGDTISARFMRQDPFEFTPQFKLVIAGNHKPSLRSVDEAIRRRMNLIPFAVTIPEQERDESLSLKLKTEWPGILKWMIEGCMDWQTDGLAQPEAVRIATEDYLSAEDSVAVWMSECCLDGKSFLTPVAVLFSSWKGWAERTGEFVGSQKRFVQTLEGRGYNKEASGHKKVICFRNIGIQENGPDEREFTYER